MNFEIPQAVKTWSQFGHPILMWVLFATAIYALYLGIKAKKTRQADKDTRKELIKGNFANRHHKVGSIFMALVVLGTIGGMAVTYINNGKLFVGPHLLAGLGMMTMVTVSASLVPYMQKGNTFARFTHVGINMSMLLVFGWQALTGVEILQRIISKL
jgi:MFS family permease